MAPVKVELLLMSRFRVETLSTIMSPSMAWLEAFRVTCPPLEPSLPQPAAAALRKTPFSS